MWKQPNWPSTHILMWTTFCLVAKFCPTLCNPMDCNMPGSSVLHYPLMFAQTHVHWVSDAIQSSHPLSPPSPPAFSLSEHQGKISYESGLHIRWPKYLTFSFSISPSSEYSGFISFRIDWVDLLAVQGTLKSLLQHHSSWRREWQTTSVFLPWEPHEQCEKTFI